ncbi:SPOR domain-containing protein [Georgenia sp. TF02-10]|uniref:SPOR domain-containing protein n=1 Tax=Georgenia sp. TF02-10 TaxID=2917725 RepID=UPI001FA77B7A|nr:SPOR domain-containing protein [Georgenia sp. TF02-10]UNX53456.1 SPOR domain-containing protein [Georgenia sp. TF02-10]
MSEQDEYYYDLATGQVERGKVSGWTRRMGPYPTAEAAREAMARARARNEQWDAEDAAWREEQGRGR